MKTNRKSLIKYLFIVFLLLPLQSCLDIFLTTDVHPNGSLDKTIVIKGDSTSILDSYIPAVMNDTWTREWLDVDDDKHKLILTKTFKNDKEFNLDMNPGDSMPAVRVNADMKRKFRWFFTYLDYTEVLLPSNPFSILDWKDFLTTREVEQIVMDEDDREEDPQFDEDSYEKTEKKFENYIYRSAFEEFYVLFVNAASQSDNSQISTSDLEENKEKIYQWAYDSTSFEDFEDLIEAYEYILGAEEVRSINLDNPEILSYFQAKLDFFNDCMDDNYQFTINMPGLLVETNSDQIESSRLSWEVDFFDFYFKGLSMEAQSRIVNIWAFVVAGIVILLLLSGLIWNLFRRRKTS